MLHVPKRVRYIEVINYSPGKKIKLFDGRSPTFLPMTYKNDNDIYQPIIYYDSNVNLAEILNQSLFYSSIGKDCEQLTSEQVNQHFKKESYDPDDFITQETFSIDAKFNMSTKDGGVGNSIGIKEVNVGDIIYLGKYFKKYKVIKITNGIK